MNQSTEHAMITSSKKQGLNQLCHIVIPLFVVMMNFFSLVNPTICNALNDTQLMFVGEELKVITIASGREEGAWSAPAIADVITRDQIQLSGAATFADLLNFEPGFLISESEAGYNIYLRGISDSVLFLNEAVPTGSKLNKNYNRINPYLSLNAVKRIEIIRGPGSVLWGPDAFAGIMNIVPLTGKDFQGVKTGIGAGNSVREKEAYLHWGRENDKWDSFISISAGQGKKYKPNDYNFVRFWGDGVTSLLVAPEERSGNGSLDLPGFFEASGNAGFGDLFKISTNVSFYSKPYTRFDDTDENIVWKEENEAFSGFIKIEGSKKYNIRSGFRWTTYFSWFDTQTQIVDLELTDRDRVSFGELVHEKSFLNGDGLLTTGVSMRQKEVTDLSVWDNYYPDYFTDDNSSFLPLVEEYDYSITTLSLFGQYRQTYGDIDIWGGIRGDDHEQSGRKISYNTGLSWNPADQWIYKISYGNAYRTPVAKQLQENKTEMENIETISMQLAWRPNKNRQFDITGYSSFLKDGYIQDPVIGLSEPVQQNLYGVEIKGRYSPVPSLDLNAGVSWVNNSGNPTHYRYNDYSYIKDGEIINHYIDIYESYDYGAKTLVNMDLIYKINKQYLFRANGRYISKREARYFLNENKETYSDVWIFGLGLKVLDIFKSTLDADVSLKNLFDTDYRHPGTFGSVEGQPFTFEIKLERNW